MQGQDPKVAARIERDVAKVVELARRSGEVVRADLIRVLGPRTPTQIRYVLDTAAERGLIRCEGRGWKAKWYAVQSEEVSS